MNMFAIGFLSSLDILLTKSITNHPPWSQTNINTPQVTMICPPGQHYENLASRSYFCLDSSHTRISIQCHQCPTNMYTDQPDQSICLPCPYGTYSFPGSSKCEHCSDAKNNSKNNRRCIQYIADKQAARKRLYMGIFIPIGVFFVSLLASILVWKCRKRYKSQQGRLGDHDWLLTYQNLVRPSMKYLTSSTVLSSMTIATRRSNSADDINGASPYYFMDYNNPRRNTIGRTANGCIMINGGSASATTLNNANYSPDIELPDTKAPYRASMSEFTSRNSMSDPDLIMNREIRNIASRFRIFFFFLITWEFLTMTESKYIFVYVLLFIYII